MQMNRGPKGHFLIDALSASLQPSGRSITSQSQPKQPGKSSPIPSQLPNGIYDTTEKTSAMKLIHPPLLLKSRIALPAPSRVISTTTGDVRLKTAIFFPGLPSS